MTLTGDDFDDLKGGRNIQGFFLRLELSRGTTIEAISGQAMVDLKLEIKWELTPTHNHCQGMESNIQSDDLKKPHHHAKSHWCVSGNLTGLRNNSESNWRMLSVVFNILPYAKFFVCA